MTEHPLLLSSLEEDEEDVVVGVPYHVNPKTGNESGSVRAGGDTFFPMDDWESWV
jgi:hypothetical protein